MAHPRLPALVTLLLVLLLAACTSTSTTTTATSAPAEPAGTAALAMPDHYSAAVATAIINQGGNAVDAAVAAAFTLAVTYPEAGNIGGGGFMLIHMGQDTTFLDYRETAPAAAHANLYLDADGNVIPDASLVGAQAAAIPGTVAGMWAAHQRYGRLPWADVVTPAAKIADLGFLVPPLLAQRIREGLTDNAGRTNFGAWFAEAATDNAVFRQPELAATLRRIAAQGPDGFYRGKTAELLVAAMQTQGGLITQADLAGYEPVWRAPLQVRWRSYDLVTAPPPSSGGIALVQLLKMKDALAEQFQGTGHNSAQYVHLVAEMEKRVFADRAEYLGDPAFVDNPTNALINDSYIERRAAEVNPSAISEFASVQPGLESPDTTHFSIVDAEGNAVSNTYTINWSFGSGVVVPGAGFLLNNEMDDFSAKPGVANIFGVVGNDANAIAGGKRPLSSMTPAMLLDSGEVEMVLGTPGGSTIFTSVFQAMVNILDFGMTPQEAVAASRFHHQLLPPDLVTHSIANPLPKTTRLALSRRGYRTEPHAWEFGDLQVITRKDGALQAASDPRGRGEAAVFTLP